MILSMSSEPQSTLDCITKLQPQINFKMPPTVDEWIDADTAEIYVWRDYALADALKERHKKTFLDTIFLQFHPCLKTYVVKIVILVQ